MLVFFLPLAIPIAIVSMFNLHGVIEWQVLVALFTIDHCITNVLISGQEVAMRPTGSPVELERRRHRAIKLAEEGRQPVEVARIVGVDRRSVRRWNAAYRKGGQVALVAIPASGRPPKLTAKAKGKLEKLLLGGAKAAGFPTDLWTCPRVTNLINKRFGVIYHVDHIGRLLRSLGFTPQKPQRRAVERDEEAIQRWVKVDWPRVKKNGSA